MPCLVRNQKTGEFLLINKVGFDFNLIEKISYCQQEPLKSQMEELKNTLRKAKDTKKKKNYTHVFAWYLFSKIKRAEALELRDKEVLLPELDRQKEQFYLLTSFLEKLLTLPNIEKEIDINKIRIPIKEQKYLNEREKIIKNYSFVSHDDLYVEKYILEMKVSKEDENIINCFYKHGGLSHYYAEAELFDSILAAKKAYEEFNMFKPNKCLGYSVLKVRIELGELTYAFGEPTENALKIEKQALKNGLGENAMPNVKML